MIAGSSEDHERHPESDRMDEANFRAQLGRATWRLLHTMAARYPDSPDAETKAYHATFLETLSHVYPCSKCAEHFRALIRADPPKVKGVEEE